MLVEGLVTKSCSHSGGLLCLLDLLGGGTEVTGSKAAGSRKFGPCDGANIVVFSDTGAGLVEGIGGLGVGAKGDSEESCES